jgi:hypothetical protein
VDKKPIEKSQVKPSLLNLLLLGGLAVAGARANPAGGGAPVDKFGVRMIYPTTAGGREWHSKWDNGHARNFTAFSGGDPDDPWWRRLTQLEGPFAHVADATRLPAAKTDAANIRSSKESPRRFTDFQQAAPVLQRRSGVAVSAGGGSGGIKGM